MAHSDDERSALGVRLADARKLAAYTLESASVELTQRGHPIGKAAVGAWETGRNVPDALWLARLAKLYQTSADGLLGRPASWPFTQELHDRVSILDNEGLVTLENVMRSHLRIGQIGYGREPNFATTPGTDAAQQGRAMTDSSVTPRTTPPPRTTFASEVDLTRSGRGSKSRKPGGVSKPGRGRGPGRAA